MDSWLPLLFIIGAVAMMLGPVMMLQPSRRQQELSALREGASQLGIRISLDNSDGKRAAVAIYSLAWPIPLKIDHWRLKQQNFSHQLHFLDDWHWEGDGRPPDSWLLPLKKILQSLPPDVVGIEGSLGSLGLFWLEKKNKTTLVMIESLLKKSQTLLLNATIGSTTELTFEPKS